MKHFLLSLLLDIFLLVLFLYFGVVSLGFSKHVIVHLQPEFDSLYVEKIILKVIYF